MLTYILIITVVLVIVNLIAVNNAADFEETGYAPQCFNCHHTDCVGCVITGPCYGCEKECTPDCPFDPILGQYGADGGYYFNNTGEIIGVYTKGDNY